MAPDIRSWRFVFILSVMLPATICESNAADQKSNLIDIRWSMVSLDRNTNPPKPKILPQDSTLKTGDRIKMYLKANNPCFFYLFYQGAEGGLHLLFPDKLPSSVIAGGNNLTLPSGDQWFELDNTTGIEIFHVIISSYPLETIETLYEDYILGKSNNKHLESRILSAILKLNDEKKTLSSKAEKPVAIGGTIRSANITGTDGIGKQLGRLAEHISTTKVFCRTYTIDHK